MEELSEAQSGQGDESGLHKQHKPVRKDGVFFAEGDGRKSCCGKHAENHEGLPKQGRAVPQGQQGCGCKGSRASSPCHERRDAPHEHVGTRDVADKGAGDVLCGLEKQEGVPVDTPLRHHKSRRTEQGQSGE